MSKAKSALIKRHNSSTAGGMMYISLVNDIYIAMSLPVAYWLEHPTGERNRRSWIWVRLSSSSAQNTFNK